MLRYDTKSGAQDFLGTFPDTDFKWTGGCIYQGVFYAFSRKMNSLLAFDLKTETFEEIPCPFSYEKEHHYGGVCTKEGIVYQPPRSCDHILKWDLNQRTCEKIQINGGAVCRYCASVLHPNGTIYFIPEEGFCVLKMDIKTEEIVPIGGPMLGFTFDPAIAPDGNIYGFRSGYETCGIVKIDTKTDAVSVLHEDVLFGAYGTKPGLNGKLYSLPAYSGDIWEFDPETEEIQIIHTLSPVDRVHYAGGAVDKNGDIYGLPVHAENLLKLQFHTEEEIPDEIYQAFFVDFY